MSKILLLTVVASAVAASAANLMAQDGAGVTEGDRVRISAAEFGERPIVGEVVARSPDTLTVNHWRPTVREWEVLDLPVSSITSLEVNRSTGSNAGKGALLGGLIGAGFGLAAGIAAASYECGADRWDWDGCWYWGEAEIIPLSTITFGLVGAGVGALIGARSRSDHWEPVPANRLGVRISPTRDGVALALAFGL